jgi:hypothetical protein
VGAYHSKLWNVSVAGSGGSAITTWDAATLLRNDPEMTVLRLMKGQNPGRATLDLTLRRGSRTIEGYLQVGTSATLAAYLATAETNTSVAASGYVTATNDDPDGNKFVAGSARTFTAHPSGGVIKAAVTGLDFWIGVVAAGGGGATLNSNPTFETDAAGWTTVNATIARSNAQAKYGSWSGLLTSTAGASPRVNSTPNSAVTAGQSYRASGWLYAPAAIASGVAVNINWYDAGNVYMSTSTNSTTPGSGAWFFMDANFTAPVGAAFANVSMWINGTPGAGVLLYGDDLRLRAAVASGDAATDLRNMYIACMPEAIYGVRR